MVAALQEAEDSYSNRQEKQMTKTTKALHSLKKDYTDLTRSHNDINADHCELLKIPSALKIRYEMLSNAKGNSRPEFSPLCFVFLPGSSIHSGDMMSDAALILSTFT